MNLKGIIEKTDHNYDTVYTFPIGGQIFYYKNGKSFQIDPILSIRVEDSQGDVWEYKGISVYSADNKLRVKGWQKC